MTHSSDTSYPTRVRDVSLCYATPAAAASTGNDGPVRRFLLQTKMRLAFF